MNCKPLTNEYFSDEEIAEVKDRFPNNDRIHALIARLEAAEGPFTSKWEEGSANWWLDYEEAKREWHKAAGKS